MGYISTVEVFADSDDGFRTRSNRCIYVDVYIYSESTPSRRGARDARAAFVQFPLPQKNWILEKGVWTTFHPLHHPFRNTAWSFKLLSYRGTCEVFMMAGAILTRAIQGLWCASASGVRVISDDCSCLSPLYPWRRMSTTHGERQRAVIWWSQPHRTLQKVQVGHGHFLTVFVSESVSVTVTQHF